ncbi:hypothetical protein [Sphingobium bisphenolivorans]|uniref:hypothetical protein n=1 Tax=Sphingobium bisphenolivorans TaxID=1335760 RepID=UPI00039C7400|nr:hypothetical protein [Sphingobium bisphenolivorans]
MSEVDLNSQAVKDAIAAAVDEAVSGLKSKNAELIAANKELKKGQEIKPEHLEAAEEARDKALADLAAAQTQIKTLTTDRDKAVKALESESGFTTKLLVENGLRDALVANGVTNGVHQKAAMAMLAGGVQIATEGDARVAKVGDKSLADFVKEWASGDEGKHFVAAPANGGGGAGGGSGSGGGKAVTRAQFDGMDHGARQAFFKDGGKVVDAAA